MAARTVQFSADALEEYGAIFRESIRLFGVDQADRYALQIDSALDTMPDNPEIGASRADLISGLRRFRVGSHFVYYLHNSEEIKVVHIYHQRRSEELGDWEIES